VSLTMQPPQEVAPQSPPTSHRDVRPLWPAASLSQDEVANGAAHVVG